MTSRERDGVARAENLERLLAAATVRVVGESRSWGSGFFVAPRHVLTCSHVVGGRAGARVVVTWEGRELPGTVVWCRPENVDQDTTVFPPPDLALVRLTAEVAHPCVLLGDDVPLLGRRVLTFGGTEEFGGTTESEMFEVTGRLHLADGPIVKLGHGQAVPGMSGSAIVDLASGQVTGMLRTSRNVNSALGGWVVPSSRIRTELGVLAAEHDRFHERARSWRSVAEDWAGLAASLLVPTSVLPSPSPPSLLLRGEYGVVPFFGRSDELKRLASWRDQPGHVALSLVVGQGGQGKTRLARKLCQCSAPDWIAGFLAIDAPADSVERLGRISTPVLLVVDYAETREAELRRLCHAVAPDGPHRIRILLLARSRSEWVDRLSRHASDEVALLLESSPTLELSPLASNVSQRESAYREAIRAFADKLGVSVDAVHPDLTEDRYRHALTLHVDALGKVLDVARRSRSASSEPSRRLLDHEARYWQRSARAAGLPDTEVELLSQVVAAATLAAGDNEHEANNIMKAVVEVPERYAARYRRWASQLYPGSRVVNPLEPDRLGEDLVAGVTAVHRELLGNLLDHASTTQRERMWTVLARGAARHQTLAELVTTTVVAEPARWAAVAVSGAIDGGEPYVVLPALSQAVLLIKDPLVLAAVAAPIPSTSVAMAQIAALIAERAVKLGAGLPDNTRAELLSAYADRLSALRRYGLAHRATAEALEIRRRLAESDDTIEPALASSLHDMSVRLGRLERDHEAIPFARDAVSIRRRLSVSGKTADRLALARSLNNLAVRLAKVDAADEALRAIEEAVELKRTAAPNDAAGQASLALSLNNLAVRRARVGKGHDAVDAIREAVRIRRQLADRFPDVHLPGLALSLNNLATRLDSIDPEAALRAVTEAVRIRERLDRQAPELHLPGLASSLDNLAARLATLSRHEEALAAVERAIALKRSLPLKRPSEVNSLATSLLNRSGRLESLGRLDEAFADAEEATLLVRQLQPDGPGRQETLHRAEARRSELTERLRSEPVG